MRVLEVNNLVKTFKLRRAGRNEEIQAVKDVSINVQAGETVGLVGESGSGKSTTARIISGLIKADSGSVRLHGQELTSLKRRDLRMARQRVPMVFQDPNSSLDPTWVLGRVLEEPIKLSRSASLSKDPEDYLEMVHLPRSFVHRYPYELSGGQRQRVAIARALACNPEVLVCDEAVAALDVSTRAGVIKLLEDIQKETGVGILFVTHDLSLVEAICNRVTVMRSGEVVEAGLVEDVYTHPQHEYTQTLLRAIPIPDPRRQKLAKP